MQREKTKWQSFLLPILMAFVLAMGQIPLVAFAATSQSQSPAQQGQSSFDEGDETEGETQLLSLSGTTEEADSEQAPDVVKYKIQSSASPGGIVATTPANEAAAGETISISTLPDNGCELTFIDVRDTSGTMLSVKDGKFEMPDSNIVITAMFAHVDNVSNTSAPMPNSLLPSSSMKNLLRTPLILQGSANSTTDVSIFYTDGDAPALVEMAHPGDQISIEQFDDFAQFGPPDRKRFAGWNVSAGDVSFISAAQVRQGYLLTVPDFGGVDVASMTLSASYEDDTYSVEFDTNGGTPAVSNQVVYNGEKATKPTADLKKGEWSFGGWYPDEQYTAEYDFNTAITRNMTLHARWNGTLSVDTYEKTWDEPGGGSFDYETFAGTGDGYATYSESTLPEGTVVSLTAHPASGYRFVGWADDDDAGNIISTDANYEFALSEPTVGLQAVFEELPVSLTIHWSSLDGVDLASPIVFNDVAKGTTLFKALADHGIDFYDARVFEKEGYVAYDSRWIPRPMNEYASFAELDDANLAGGTQLNGDLDVYVPIGKAIQSASMTIAAPVCGTDTTTPVDKSAWAAQTNPPQLTIPEGVKYSPDEEFGYHMGVWLNPDDAEALYETTFAGGKDYLFEAHLVPEYGYAFAANCTGTLDGGTLGKTEAVPELFAFNGSVEAVHEPSEPVKENIVEPTCTDEGSYDEVVYCAGCKEKLSSEHKTVEAIGHEWGEWKTVQEPTEQEEGLQERTCSHCGLVEQEPIAKLEASDSAPVKFTMPITGDNFVVAVVVGIIAVIAIGLLVYAFWRRRH